MDEPPPLDEAFAVEFLRNYGFAKREEPLQARVLEGGVSSRVIRVDGTRRGWVLKQPLEHFRVAREWRVDPRRVFVEYRFTRTLGDLLPAGSLAPAATFAAQFRLLVFEAAPRDWKPWKTWLLAGDIGPRLADAAGRLLGAIHEAGTHARLRGRFQNDALFHQQRLDPYFGATADAQADLRRELADVGARFRARSDLVHGDFSPKNLLTDGEALRLIDHEVATRGDAAFDAAFLLNHVLLKAIHLPAKRTELLDLGTRFLRAYVHARAASDPAVEQRAVAYLGPLLLARAWGKSPVEYLSPGERDEATRTGRAWTRAPPADWSAARSRLV